VGFASSPCTGATLASSSSSHRSSACWLSAASLASVSIGHGLAF
jgi:hypothetical protein